MLLPNKYNGINVPVNYFNILFKNNTIIDKLKILYPDLDPSNDIYCQILISKIKNCHYKSLQKSDKAILSVFQKEGLTFINSVITNQVNRRITVDINWNILSSNLKEGISDSFFLKYPIYQVIVKILITQRSKVQEVIMEEKEILDNIQRSPGQTSYSGQEIETLESLFITAKKALTVIDMHTISIPEIDDGVELPNPINRNLIKAIKSIGFNEMLIRKIKQCKVTAKSLFDSRPL